MSSLLPARPYRYLILLPAVIAMGSLALSCSSGSSPTEPDSVASVESSPGSSGSSGSSNADNSGSNDGSGDADGSGGSQAADGSGDSGSSTTDPEPGVLTLNLTDLPTDEICQLWVYFAELRVKADGQSAQIVPLGFDAEAYDLLTLRNGAEVEMGSFAIDQGKYQFIEILLDESQSYVVEKDADGSDCSIALGDEAPLQIPSEKFKVRGNPFEVDDATAITIDFDADASLKRKGSSNNPKGWQLLPNVSIVRVDP